MKRTLKKEPRNQTLAETDQKIEQLVDTAITLLDDLRLTTDRVEGVLKRTREVTKQYAKTEPKTGSSNDDTA